MDKSLEDLRIMIYDEIAATVKQGKLDANILEPVGMAVDILKDLHEIEMGGEEGSSFRPRPQRYYRQNYGYSPSTRARNNKRNYNGMSGHNEVVDYLSRIVNEPMSDEEKDAIYQCIQELQEM